MSYCVERPEIVRGPDGSVSVTDPSVTCDDCGQAVRWPGRVYRVGRRLTCVFCFCAPRVAPSVLEYRVRPPGGWPTWRLRL